MCSGGLKGVDRKNIFLLPRELLHKRYIVEKFVKDSLKKIINTKKVLLFQINLVFWILLYKLPFEIFSIATYLP